MKLNVDLVKLRQILKDFHILTGASICIFDIDYTPITAYPDEPPAICKLVKSTKEGFNACALSDKTGCELCAKNKKTVSYVCHAGLIDTVTPIMHNNIVYGYIMFGQVTNSEINKKQTLKRIIESCEKYGLQKEEICKIFSKLKFLDNEKYQAATNIMVACSCYIFLSDMIQIDNEMVITQIIDFFDEHYKENISIKDIEKNFFLTKNKIYQLFEKNYHTTPIQYLNSVRLSKSKELILYSDLTLTEICEQCGFNNYNYFIKQFKSVFGEPPHRFKKKINYKAF